MCRREVAPKITLCIEKKKSSSLIDAYLNQQKNLFKLTILVSKLVFIIWVHNLFIICVHFGVAVYDFWLQLRKLIPNSSMQRHSNKNAKQMFPQKSIASINSKQKTACERALNHEHWKFAQFITRLIQTKYIRPRLQWLWPSLPDHLYALTEVKLPFLYSKNFELHSNFKLPKCSQCITTSSTLSWMIIIRHLLPMTFNA